MYMKIHILHLDQFNKKQCPICHPYKNNLYMYICKQTKKIYYYLKIKGGGLTCAQPPPPSKILFYLF